MVGDGQTRDGSRGSMEDLVLELPAMKHKPAVRTRSMGRPGPQREQVWMREQEREPGLRATEHKPAERTGSTEQAPERVRAGQRGPQLREMGPEPEGPIPVMAEPAPQRAREPPPQPR